ncbi:hypothetical protein LMG24238_02260 [Paraburkholderia sediminicola]|uniref:Uncharacterized protein n=1 Tax=Paraburkholderia sediminicola TaxID=458836 RepID=A0A6J5AM27_9BURK|nr:hypothetical protein [Paraburkholderia sediminicola]CAB3674111.1 hypothetical protein LMG24238_02260 [Paraburkholderia sediminicola]
MRKNLPFILSVFCVTQASAAVICYKDIAACDLYLDKSGSLLDRSTGDVVANNVGNVGMFSDVAVYKYSNQYVLVQENHSSDRLVTAIPLAKLNEGWAANSVYYFSISLMDSSAKSGPLWSGRKVVTQNLRVTDDILDRAGELASKQQFGSLLSSGWPSTKLYVATSTLETRSEQCFIPFGSEDSALPLDLMACRPLKVPMNNGQYDLTGLLDKKYLIELTLNRNGNSISGRYRYLHRSDKFIKVEGSLAQDGTLSMTEFGGKSGGISGYFYGVVVDGAFSGEWMSPDKTRRLPFFMYMQGFPQ